MITDWRKRFLQKVLAPEIVGRKAAEIRAEGRTIVTLNGTFDLLHAGHLHIIYEAKKQGMVLIVALNTDSSIKALKGEGKPYVPLEERLQMVAALEFVDYVTWFHEADPNNFIKTVKPHVHVNGSEYGKNCIEAPVLEEIGSKLHIVERIPGLSTSQIVAKIRSQPACVS